MVLTWYTRASLDVAVQGFEVILKCLILGLETDQESPSLELLNPPIVGKNSPNYSAVVRK